MSILPEGEKRFVYFYLNRDDPEQIRQVVADHVAYWKTAVLKGYMGGPFGDRTGGLISFIAPSLEVATRIILQDPFLAHNLVTEKWIRHWLVE